MYRFLLTAALIVPVAAFAAGSDDDEQPKPTETTTQCDDGKIWDSASQTCVDAQDSRLDDDARYLAVREFAYAGQPENALKTLRAMADQGSDRVLTYLGFTHRQLGRIPEAMAYYERALAINPDNLLARSYLGQGFVEQGDLRMAEAQLDEILARGGAGGWPAISLASAISTGETYTY